MNGHLDFYLLEIAAGPDSIPVSDCLPNGLTASSLLNSIMAQLPFDYSTVFGELVVLVHSHEGAVGYAVWSLQHHRTSSPFPQKLFHGICQSMKEILWAARYSTFVFGLLKVQGCSPSQELWATGHSRWSS